MTRIYNRNADKKKRQRLRNNMTEAEKHLWQLIRYKKLGGIKFRRQYSVAGFVIDFYCPKLKLAIEVDGGIHLKPDVKAYDKHRERIIRSLGITFLRLTNDQVINESTRSIEIIQNKIAELLAEERKATIFFTLQNRSVGTTFLPLNKGETIGKTPRLSKPEGVRATRA